MIDVPPDLPKDYPESYCIAKAAADNRLPQEILWAIRIVESGKRGDIKQNKDGSVDVGVMQINSVHFKFFQGEYGVKPSWLVWNQCMSIIAGGFRLAKEIKREGNFWSGVGAYHSRTPSLKSDYEDRVRRVLERNHYDRRLLASEAWRRFGSF